MTPSRPSLCITCGLDAGAGRPLNRMMDGRVCPSCAERLLDMLPPPFPGFGHLIEATSARRVGKADEESKGSAAALKKARRGRKPGPK